MAGHGRRPSPCCPAAKPRVTVRGGGRGGRNAEFLLALAIALEGLDGIHALAADTDGLDGNTDCACAVMFPARSGAGRPPGVSGPACLDDNDAFRYFAALDGLIRTGPTRTNANDYRAILIA